MTAKVLSKCSSQSKDTHQVFEKHNSFSTFSSIWGFDSGGKIQRKWKLKQTKLVFGKSGSLLVDSSTNRKRALQEDKGSAEAKKAKMDLNLDDLGDLAT